MSTIDPLLAPMKADEHREVVGDEPAVLIEFDFEGDTVSRLGVPAHRHS